MKTFDFTVRRPMDGDRHYEENEVRNLSVLDAAHLVRSGALEPKGKDAAAAVEEHLGPRETWGVQPVPAGAETDAGMDANNARAAAEGAQPRPAASRSARNAATKDGGAAPKNKADITAPETGTVHAGEPGVTPVDGAAAETTPPPPPPPPPPPTARRAAGRSGGRRR